MSALKFRLPFVKKEKLNEEVYTFYFDRKIFKFNYLAGQYFRITIPIENPDNSGSSRYFTMSSAPNDEFLSITTKIIKSSFKLKLYNLKTGDMVTFFGPFGEMFQKENDMTPKIFLAGGIGMTPAHSMLRFIDSKKIKVRFTLLASFSNKKDVIFFEEFKAIESRNPNVSIAYTLTKEKGRIGYESGRIDEGMIKKYVPKISTSKIFLGGPPNLVESLQAIMHKIGLLEENVIVESFTGY